MFEKLFGSTEKSLPHTWNLLSEMEQLEKIKKASFQKPQVLFKHSTRCSISSMAYNRLEKRWGEKSEAADFYYLDLIKHRDISNQIASLFHVPHQSPQMLVIKNGICELDASHGGVGVDLLP